MPRGVLCSRTCSTMKEFLWILEMASFLTFKYQIELCADDNALCGYPLVKVPVEKICCFAPILLGFDYFRQKIWRLFFAQFHF